MCHNFANWALVLHALYLGLSDALLVKTRFWKASDWFFSETVGLLPCCFCFFLFPPSYLGILSSTVRDWHEIMLCGNLDNGSWGCLVASYLWLALAMELQPRQAYRSIYWLLMELTGGYVHPVCVQLLILCYHHTSLDNWCLCTSFGGIWCCGNHSSLPIMFVSIWGQWCNPWLLP